MLCVPARACVCVCVRPIYVRSKIIRLLIKCLFELSLFTGSMFLLGEYLFIR